MENTALQIAVESKSRVEVLEDRFDRHMGEQKQSVQKLENKFDIMLDKIESIKDIVHENRVEHFKDFNSTNKKIYTINGIIAVFLIALKEVFTWVVKH